MMKVSPAVAEPPEREGEIDLRALERGAHRLLTERKPRGSETKHCVAAVDHDLVAAGLDIEAGGDAADRCCAGVRRAASQIPADSVKAVASDVARV